MNKFTIPAGHALRPSPGKKVVSFPARNPCPHAANALLDGEGFFTQSDEDFLADLGLAANDPHISKRRAFRPA
ncbi:MAG TPA: hypothetical protein VHQ87_16030 [Rhizobacter sp.]|jgi:hypothetical protein|nr:hypothetical protein [Rhizobacter sp.]